MNKRASKHRESLVKKTLHIYLILLELHFNSNVRVQFPGCWASIIETMQGKQYQTIVPLCIVKCKITSVPISLKKSLQVSFQLTPHQRYKAADIQIKISLIYFISFFKKLNEFLYTCLNLDADTPHFPSPSLPSQIHLGSS